MEPNEQNQHFTELRQEVAIYSQELLLQKGLPSLYSKHELDSKKGEKRSAKLEPD